MSKAGSKHLTQSDFDAFKALQAAKVSPNKAAKVLSRSGSTAYLIYKADNFEEYRKTITEINRRKPSNQSHEPEKPTDTDQLAKLFSNIHVRLDEIDVKLDDMFESIKWVENHTEVKPRKRLF